MIKHILIAAGLAVFAGGAAASAPSSIAESNGYKSCVSAAERSARLLRVEPTYFIRDEGDSRTFYLNGSGRLSDGSRTIKIACETTPSGSRVLAVSVDSGRYAGRVVSAAELAAN